MIESITAGSSLEVNKLTTRFSFTVFTDDEGKRIGSLRELSQPFKPTKPTTGGGRLKRLKRLNVFFTFCTNTTPHTPSAYTYLIYNIIIN